jgi:glutamate synthase (ferredoxin)
MAVGMLFLPAQPELQSQIRQIINDQLSKIGLEVLGWRPVPVNPGVLGVQAKENQPDIAQVIVAAPMAGEELERLLYLARKRIGQQIATSVATDEYYVCSFSSRTIVYKGMVRSEVLGQFYLDLADPDFQSAFAVYHRRFSTNTLPKWPLAQPMRLLGHNGEINTLLGNLNWTMAREADFAHECWGEKIKEIRPIIVPTNSDSASLDNVMELLVRSNFSAMESLMIMVPEAYQNQPDLENYPEITSFYEYYSGLQEPWDGPALLVFSDGKVVGATLDRNGLRPARYCITKDGLVVVGSEAGVVALPEADIVEKGRLGPGQMIAVDLLNQEILKNWQIKQRVASRYPYGQWLASNRKTLEAQPMATDTLMDAASLIQRQTIFGYTAEDLDLVIQDMAATGKEPTFCMGDDIPLAVLSSKPHLLYDYFKQRFAQVTNPPIDPLREKLVMSLTMQLGARHNILQPGPAGAKLIQLSSPVLNEAELAVVKAQAAVLSTLYPVAEGPQGLAAAVARLQKQAMDAIATGQEILILSDRTASIDDSLTYIPPLLAVGAVHHYLIRQGMRMRASLVVETAQCWSTHHFACLIGYGASAICPYLAWETVRQWWQSSRTQSLIQQQKLTQITIQQAQENYRKAVEEGLLKILSKMGISLLSSYQAAQIFEAIGIGRDLLELGFTGTTSRLGGLSVVELAQEVMAWHSQAFPAAKKLENLGFVQYRPGAEYHMNSPEMAKALHRAVRASQDGLDFSLYELYQKQLASRPPTALRDLLEFQADRCAIPLAEVESVTEIVRRFCTGGMSLGALSREAHEVLAIAMNRIGGKSNSGEGGEDPVRYHTLDDVDEQGRSAHLLPHLKGLRNGDTANSAIKQVASGRFGVTPEYLMSAQQIEIKIAQGAKPGEGGQLPGPKVSAYIAMLRRSKPGVSLISPPPHHDIYSIEDLAQLIFDLHQINPQAQVSVKLVAEVGIGTVAAGVAKANADVIQVSGHDGGTGASPLSSIKHAGGPWELGLTEVHRVLMENQLRDRVILRVDGGLKTGWDVVMAALMGAEEYGFGSIAMIAEGCIMARICHTNNCPVGVASQKEELRQRFNGVPGDVVNFFYFVAEEVRHILAHLGYRSLNEVIGRADLLRTRTDINLGKVQNLNLDCLTQLPDTRNDRTWLKHEPVHSNGPVLDNTLLTQLADTIQTQGTTTQTITIVNTDRTVGARIAGTIAKKYGNNGFAGQITLKCQGAAGQSFGAFNLPGMTLHLTGEANDYVGKGMHGGEIVIVPSPTATYCPEDNVIIGNTCLYGATGGFLFANGQAGERFAVRNSQAKAVITGAGDHCCEYMTGGVVVVLGRVGRNVGAGMTGGLGYFLDEDGGFSAKVNPEIVKIQRVTSEVGQRQLRELIETFVDRTSSQKGQQILADWAHYLPQFWQVVPPSEANSPEVAAAPAASVIS